MFRFGDVLCARDFLSEKMSAVTKFVKECHEFVTSKSKCLVP